MSFMPTGSIYTAIKVNSICPNVTITDGSVIDTGATEVIYNWGNFTPVSNIPSKDVTDTWNNRLGVVDYLGHENPTISITGMIDTGKNIPTSIHFVPDRISVEILGSFIRCGSVIYFYDNKITPLTGLGSQATILKNCKIRRTVQYQSGDDFGHLLEYSLDLVETKA